MEPNNNMQNRMNGAGAPGMGAGMPPRPMRAPGFAAGAPRTGTPSTSMPNTPDVSPADAGGDVVFQDKPKKKSHAMLYGMIFLAILAVAGIGFGVWAMLDGNSRAQKKDEQISQLQSQLAEKSEVVVDDDTTVVDDVDDGGGTTSTSVVNTADYIYVGEWGIKIKIPEGLNRVSYEFKQHGDDQTEGTTVAVSGTVGDGLPDFANIYKNISSLGTVSRVLKNAYENYNFPDEMRECGYEGLVFSDDKYNYCYGHPQSVYSTVENEQALETESVTVIQQMLNNKENYSRF